VDLACGRFKLKYVVWLIPALRQISATGNPDQPAIMTKPENSILWRS
jgi:hypothetical protein